MMKRVIAAVVTVVAILTFAGVYASSRKSSAPEKMPSAAESPDAGALSGKVVETMNAGGYTYVLIEKKGNQTWVAIPETQVSVGEDVAFQPGQEMTAFRSNTLKRTFDSIVFSGGLAAAANKHGGSKAAAAMTMEKIKVEKAQGPNSYTVEEIFSQSKELNKKTAMVKAKVVKISANIMGKNWIHLQDGTGDASSGTNDLIATSQDLPAVGDVVTVKGTVYKDKDFGSGYKYDVIMENAAVQK